MKLQFKKRNNFLKILLFFVMIFFFNNANANYKNTFFDFSIKSIDGKVINLEKYNNKVILVVNVASKCGFTKQYNDLQNLWDKYRNKGLIVLGIPSNQFNQELDTDVEIKNFCETNFNITFPLTAKISVKGADSHQIYKWAKKNYGSSAIPKWNFHKILINKNGRIEDTFSSFTNPMSKKITTKIEKILDQ